MKKYRKFHGIGLPWLFVWMGLFLAVPEGVLAQWQAERELVDSFYSPGKMYAVKITITGPPGPITLWETPPKGWTVTRLPFGGEWMDGVIQVLLPDFTGRTQLNYRLVSPAQVTDDVSFAGRVGEVPIGGASVIYIPRPLPGLQAPLRTGLHYNYLLYLPETYGPESPRFPLILFLHGATERGVDLNLLKQHGLPKLLANPANSTKYPELFQCIVASPQSPARDLGWQSQPLKELVDELMTAFPVDPSRVYVTGLSLGGFGTWDFTSHYPDLIAAAIPICGAKIPSIVVENLIGIPIWAFHGMEDNVVPFADGKALVEELIGLGGNVKFTAYPNVGHDSWSRTYIDPAVWTWLLSQAKPTAVNSWMCY